MAARPPCNYSLFSDDDARELRAGRRRRPEDGARLNFTFSREDILRGRAIEDRLAEGLFRVPGFTIIPALRKFHTSTLVIHGDSGHFSCIDAPERVHRAIDDFFRL